MEGRSPGTNWNHLLCAVALFELFAGQTLELTPDCYPLILGVAENAKAKNSGLAWHEHPSLIASMALN
ncbi:hypothetical protein [Endozoicomonas lisbonensis]|uniref:Uncharacterized protein n=1 Tax=Endozoicomonas lisbonensis TaxID=3120522 RepID=A0ABV2SCX6_9GAMM